MKKTEGNPIPRYAILNLVGLCGRHLGPNMPILTRYAREQNRTERTIRPVLPALTCSAQATYLTGKLPSEHGIVGNGWYDRKLNEHHFWKQSNQLVEGEKLWERIRRKRPGFRCAKLFWWYNMYSSVDFSITPRPLYGSDGNKVFDVHTHPLPMREQIKRDLGEFPFSAFWGPRAGLASSKWIAAASRWIEEKHSPDLSLIYLPHLDYDLQRFGPSHPKVKNALNEVDQIAGDLIRYFEKKGVRVLVLSEYGISNVDHVIYPNRAFRSKGWLSLKKEFGGETIDCGSSRAFALTDHQIAHVYLPHNHPTLRKKVRACLESLNGVAEVLEGEDRAGLNHQRSGDLVALAKENAWFAYYHWEKDSLAPEFARCIDIHRKYGYDPAELFFDPKLTLPTMRALRKLIAKRMGFRIHMDLIPLDSSVVGGSHGIIPEDPLDWPVIFGPGIESASKPIQANEIFSTLTELLGG